MKNIVLKVNNLTKHYKDFTAVNGISFAVKNGETVGFLGPNGAGKTTTIQMLLGITQKTTGEIFYFDQNFDHHRQECLQRINFASAFNTLQGRITIWENLLVFAYLYQVKNPKEKIMELVRYFDSEDLLHKLYWNLSAGQKTRINIIKSLLNDPELILMDEPTASLDPDVADKTLSLIESMKEHRSISILYTSHNMDEITRICDKVIFLEKGNIVAEDTPLNLTKKIGKARLILTFDGKKTDITNFLKPKALHPHFIKEYIVQIETEEKDIADIITGLTKKGVSITDIEVKKPTLEDFFLQIARGGNHVD